MTSERQSIKNCNKRLLVFLEFVDFEGSGRCLDVNECYRSLRFRSNERDLFCPDEFNISLIFAKHLFDRTDREMYKDSVIAISEMVARAMTCPPA